MSSGRARYPPSAVKGRSQRTVVPQPTGLWTENVPPRASIRSCSPVSPEPCVGTAPPDAVITHAHVQHVARGLGADLDNRGTCVLGCVCQRLGDHVVGGHLDRFGQSAVDPDVYLHRDGGAPRQRAQCGTQPRLGQDRRVYPLRDLPQVIDHAHELSGYARDVTAEPLAHGGRRRHAQPERDRDEALLRAVMQVTLDPTARLIGCGNEPDTGSHQLGPALRGSDRRRN